MFNMAVSNSDDHLRNHGFLLAKNGWRLSPAYDMNPDPYRNTLSLNVDENSNLMDISLAIDAAFYFGISKDDAHSIARDVLRTVSNNWERMAVSNGIRREELETMRPAFYLADSTRL